MNSIILSLLSSHIISIVESLIVAAEPTVIAEIQLLISKLETYIEGKVPAVAAVVNPVLAAASNDAPAGIANAAAMTNNTLNAIGAGIQTPQSVG